MIEHIIREAVTYSLHKGIDHSIKGERYEIDAATGGRLFRHHVLQRLLALVLIAVPLAMLGWLSTFPDKHNQAYITYIIMLSFSSLGCLTAWIFFRKRIVVTTEGLQGTMPWSGFTKIDWNDLKTIEYSSLSNKFKFFASDGRCLSMSVVGTDLNPLLEECENNLQGSMFQNLSAGYKQLKRELPAYDAMPRHGNVVMAELVDR